MPELHVIGAGSLLEFALIQGKFSFPVGRVQFIYLRPLSFLEFANALKLEPLLEKLKTASSQTGIEDSIHNELMQAVKQYFLIGGMPAVVNNFITSQSFLDSSRIQDLLLATYRADFNKYATEAELKYLRILLEGISYQIGQQFKYAKIDPHIKSRELKTALNQLEWAGLIHPIFATSASGIPLAAQIKQNKFKPLLLDIGLAQRALQVDPEIIWQQDLIQIHAGALAEQFVGQELMAYADFFREERLFFWEREKASSVAEVDYVITVGQSIVPIEVKAGAAGHLKSLRQFMEEKKSPLGIRVSQHPLSYEAQVLSVPFYMIDQIPRLVKELT
jgi:predicted AAA+ superfamily ATPase